MRQGSIRCGYFRGFQVVVVSLFIWRIEGVVWIIIDWSIERGRLEVVRNLAISFHLISKSGCEIRQSVESDGESLAREKRTSIGYTYYIVQQTKDLLHTFR